MKQLILTLLASAMILTACKTEIDPSDTWQTFPVIYGIIDPGDSVHTIRINRSFLGNSKPDVMATESDSLIYDFDVDVWVHVLNDDNQLIASLRFEKTFVQKDSLNLSGEAVFGTRNHHIYASRGVIPSGEDVTYELEIIYPNGKIVRAMTSGVGSIRHVSPNPPYNYFSLAPSSTNNISLQYFLPPDEGAAEIGFRLFYYEVRANGAIQKKYLWFRNNFFRLNSSVTNGRLQFFRYKAKDILQKVREELDSTNADIVNRYLGRIEIRYQVANKDMADVLFHRVGTLNSEIGIPGNIIGGNGFFASRRILPLHFSITSMSFDNYNRLLPHHKFMPKEAYQDFMQNLPDSLR